jgi:WD40 repeat protein
MLREGRVSSLYTVMPLLDRLASGSFDQTVRIWDAKTGQPLSTIEGYQSFARSVAFSRDGLHLETDQGSTLLPVTAPSGSFLAPQPLAKRIFVAER